MQDKESDIKASYYVDVAGLSMHCRKIGSGGKLVFAFHGYANSASMFQFLAPEDCTILSFDLPFQGETKGIPDWSFSKKDLSAMIQEQMRIMHADSCTLLGYSLGARVCLCILEEMPDEVDSVILVAPDGIRKSYFYELLTGTLVGRSFFRGFVWLGGVYIALFTLLYWLRILPASKYKFMMHYIRTKALRQHLYDIWYSTSQLVPQLSQIKRSVEKYNIPIHLLMGRLDHIIPLKNARAFKGRSEMIHIHVFDRGHNLLQFQEVRGMLVAWLLRPGSRNKN